jgi:putative hydrolase of the HAD superfamily
MSFIGHAFVDWDDTIAENIRYFDETEAITAALIVQATGADLAFVHKRGRELDVVVATRLGLVRDSLCIAWTECYHEACTLVARRPDPGVLAEIASTCRMPYEVKQTLLPGALEMLSWLHAESFEITIWTAGDQEVQQRKVRDSGLSHLIHRVEVVLEKTPERLHLALGERDRSRSFVMGNSARSDIHPALTIGVMALHIPVESWAYDLSHLDVSSPHYHRINDRSHLLRLLSDRFQPGRPA